MCRYCISFVTAVHAVRGSLSKAAGTYKLLVLMLVLLLCTLHFQCGHANNAGDTRGRQAAGEELV